MSRLNILKTTVLVALAAAPFITLSAQSGFAQRVVNASCPQGYTLSGNVCIRQAPAPSCPSGYRFSAGKCVASTPAAKPVTKTASAGQWALVTREAFGVRKATELDGANFCAVSGSSSVDDAKGFFKDNGLTATHVKVDTTRDGIEKYQKYECDILVVADRAARSTADSLKPKGGHVVLPEKFGTVDTTPVPVATAIPAAPVATPKATPAPLPPQQPATVKQKPKPTPKKVVRKKRCSAVRYGYSRGNTCACAGGRVFNGRSCVRPRRW